MERCKKITSLQHPFVSYWKALVQEKNARREEKRVVVFGKKLILELLERKKLKRLITTKEIELPCEEHYIVTEEILKKISKLPSTDGFAAEVELFPPEDVSSYSKIMILDQLSDPGNLGTLIRTAYALGWDAVIVTPTTVDLFNDKAIRASKGISLFFPYQEMSIEEIEKLPHQLFIAHMKGKEPSSFIKKEKIALVLSNESNGINPWHRGEKVAIKMRQGAESLNVAIAGSILLYEL